LTSLLCFLISCETIEPQEHKEITLTETEKTLDYPARQIHLDFHTSEHVEGIGEAFDKKEFQEALQLAHVNSINLFAKGWHGWSYYDTQIGNRHPHLNFDLLEAQIEACREIGVKACVYFAAGHAETDGERHPEWRAVDRNGEVVVRKKLKNIQADAPRPDGTWTYMAPVDAYLNHMLQQTEEVCKNYNVDGFWYDGVYTHPVSFNPELLEEMRAEGMDPNDDEEVFLYGVEKWQNFMEQCHNIIKKYHPDASVFFNGTTEINNEKRNFELKTFRFNTKNDLEDLPTTSWGWYDKFPLRSKLFHNENKPVIAMSGKFHEGWGEFGGFKHPDAIRYEAASMIAYGAACNFGDQLHPSGKIDLETYKNIGQAYEYVKEIEAFGVGGKPVANLGLWFTNEQASDEGVNNMLLETQTDFEVIDPQKNLEKYQVIIIPSEARLQEKDATKIKQYVENGGKLLVIGTGALNEGKNRIVLPVGATYQGKPLKDVDYMLVKEEIGEGIIKSPFLCNIPALRTQPVGASKVLAQVYEPYFSRTYSQYFSHRNTPPQTEPAPHPAIIRNGNVIFFAHNIDQIYFEFGARLHRDVFMNALHLLYESPMLQTDMPSAARVSLLHQPVHQRYVAHLLFATPIKRGRVHVIEDLVPLYDIPLSLKVPETVTRAYTVPGFQLLEVKKEGERNFVTVPEVTMHKAVVFEYKR